MSALFIQFPATRQSRRRRGDTARGQIEANNVAFFPTIPPRSSLPRLVCTWRVDPIDKRPVAVWITRP